MTSKAEYLKKYLSGEDGKKQKKKKKLKVKKHTNLAILDDDVDWRTTAPKHEESDTEEDPDDAPLVANVLDEMEELSTKWQPVVSSKYDGDDLSPPRKKLRGSPDLSKRHDSPDLSPPRKKRLGKYDSPSVPPSKEGISRNKSHQVDQETDVLGSPDFSPLRRQCSSPDLSPPRNQSKQRSHLSSPRRPSYNVSDLRPPRGRKGDLSPPRKKRHDSPDLSPPRRAHNYKRHDSPDASPPRRHDVSKRYDTSDISPLRRQHGSPGLSPSARRNQVSRDLSPPRKGSMASGAKVGLQSARILRQENVLARENQAKFYKGLDPELSGRHAETVYRDKEGKRIDPKLEKLRKREEERKKMEEDEKFMGWGRGVAQSRLAHEKLADELYEMSKPLARHVDDEDLERMLKERKRDGDPMLKYLKKRKTKVEGKPKKEKPTYKGTFPLNRFGIRPGYRWDGVDRSNGFEKARFARESNRKATAEEAYKWSIEDM